MKIESHINSAEILAALYKFKEANEAYITTEKINASIPELYISWGTTLQKTAQHKEAIEKFNKALNLEPESTEAMYYLALSLAETGECNNAISLLNKVLAKDPNYTEVYTKLGGIYNKLNDRKKALEYYEIAAGFSGNTNVNFLIASTYYIENDFPNALIYFNKHLETHPDHFESLVNLAIINNKLGDKKESIRKIKRPG